MKALILLLFLATVGGFSLSLRSCCQCNPQIAKDLAIDTQEVLNANPSLTGIHPSYDHLDVVLRGTIEQGMKQTAAKQVQAGLVQGALSIFSKKSRPHEAQTSFGMDVRAEGGRGHIERRRLKCCYENGAG